MTKDVIVSRLSKNNAKEKFSWLLENTVAAQNLSRICIKPNLNDYRGWESASTCDPNLLDALLSALRNRFPDASISIIENDSTSVNADNIFSYLGFNSIAKKYGCECVNVGREPWKSVQIDGLHFKTMEIPERLAECFFITFPKLKSHSITRLTCGLKNQMGLFRPKRKIMYHHMVNDLIVDCNLAMRPSLAIIDANLVMEGNFGPTYGSPRRLGLIMASTDVVAVDSLCARFFGFKPKSISYIKKAAEKGLGDMNFNIISDFDFDIRKYKLKFSNVLYRLIRKGSAGLLR
jgi:uncharacterized protein (DUF362 family)